MTKPVRKKRRNFLDQTRLQGSLFIIIFLAGAIGWIWHPGPHPMSVSGYMLVNDLYRSLQIFTLNYDHPDESKWHPDLLLNVIRFVAPAFLVVAIVTSLSRRSFYFLIQGWNWVFYRHSQYLIIGYGRIGQGLAVALKTKGRRRRVIAIDHRVTPLDRQTAEAAGIELYAGDAQDLESLSRLPFSLARMQRIFVALNNDQQTIATSAKLAEELENRPDRIWMQLNDWTLLDRLRNSSVLAEAGAPARNVRSFSMAEALGTQLVAQHRPALMARTFGQNRLHAVLVRFDDFVWAMAEALILNGATPPPRLSRPRLTIIDAKADALAAKWRARHSYLHQWVDIGFFPAEPNALAWSAEAPLLQEIETLDPPTMYIFGRSGDGDALSDALSLRHGMEKGLRQPAPVFLTTEVQGVAMLGLREIAEDLQNRLYVIGDDSEMAQYSHAVDPAFETLSLRFFAAYKRLDIGRDHEGPRDEYVKESETFQISNRRAAVHALQILAWLGFEEANATKARLGLTVKAGQMLCALLTKKVTQLPGGQDTYLDAWALYEHLRWCVDRAIDGWREGARDNEARFRGQMNRGRYDYKMLDSKEIDKDEDQARAVVMMLTEQNGEVRHWEENPEKFARIETVEQVCNLCWRFENDKLILDWANGHPGWELSSPQPDLHRRYLLSVPAEQDLAAQNPDFRALEPNLRKEKRLDAYRDFIDGLPKCKWLHFRFMRARAEGWEWLPKNSGDGRVDGVTLPPLTIGFAGARNLAPYGGYDAVKAIAEPAIKQILDGQRVTGRPLRLIIGAAKGADQIMLDIWRDWARETNYPAILLVPDPKEPQKIGGTRFGIRELVLFKETDDYKEAKNEKARNTGFADSEKVGDDEVFVEVAERILNVSDILIALYYETVPKDDTASKRNGGTEETVKLAKFLGIETQQIQLRQIDCFS